MSGVPELVDKKTAMSQVLFGRTTQIDNNSLWPVVTPAGRLRFAAASKMLAHFFEQPVHHKDTATKYKAPA